VPVILIDKNIEGQGTHIWLRMQSAPWSELTKVLDVIIRTFSEVGLEDSASDDEVWRFCQARGHYLLTSNRNLDSEESLEATIRREGTSSSLPVFTIPLPDRVYERAHVDRVIEKLFDYILNADNIAGVGRLYLP